MPCTHCTCAECTELGPPPAKRPATLSAQAARQEANKLPLMSVFQTADEIKEEKARAQRSEIDAEMEKAMKIVGEAIIAFKGRLGDKEAVKVIARQGFSSLMGQMVFKILEGVFNFKFWSKSDCCIIMQPSSDPRPKVAGGFCIPWVSFDICDEAFFGPGLLSANIPYVVKKAKDYLETIKAAQLSEKQE